MDMNEHRLISRENCIAMIEALNRSVSQSVYIS